MTFSFLHYPTEPANCMTFDFSAEIKNKINSSGLSNFAFGGGTHAINGWTKNNYSSDALRYFMLFPWISQSRNVIIWAICLKYIVMRQICQHNSTHACPCLHCLLILNNSMATYDNNFWSLQHCDDIFCIAAEIYAYAQVLTHTIWWTTV